MSTAWGHVDVVTLVAMGIILVALAAVIALTVWGRRNAAVAREAADRAEAATQPPDRPVAAAQVGTSRTFQIGIGLSIYIAQLQTGLQLRVTIHNAMGGGDLSTSYPISDELAREIAAKLTRSRD
jgi:hypothetical protein